MHAVRGVYQENWNEYLNGATAQTKNCPTCTRLRSRRSSVTEILVDKPTNKPKSILKNQASQITAPQSPPKDQTVNPIRAGILQSPTMDVAPDSHQHKNITCRTTTEAVDLTQPAFNTETTPSKPKTKRIKRSLLLEPLSCDETPISSPLSIVSRKMKLKTLNTS